jgi:hypothetical protein
LEWKVDRGRRHSLDGPSCGTAIAPFPRSGVHLHGQCNPRRRLNRRGRHQGTEGGAPASAQGSEVARIETEDRAALSAFDEFAPNYEVVRDTLIVRKTVKSRQDMSYISEGAQAVTRLAIPYFGPTERR